MEVLEGNVEKICQKVYKNIKETQKYIMEKT